MTATDTPEKNGRNESPASTVDRRALFAKLTAGGLAFFAFVVPAFAGLVALLNPLRLKGSGGQLLKLANLDALPEDGTPRRFPVVTERVDAWTRAIEPIGAVYLRRTGKNQVEALQVICPHAGCTVERNEVTDSTGNKIEGFLCPCHKATFDLGGKRLDKVSQSPRDLDTLEVEIRNGTEVWVRYERFQTGSSSKVPVA